MMKELDVKKTQKLLNRIMEFELAGVPVVNPWTDSPN
jgi:hypothetical protein